MDYVKGDELKRLVVEGAMLSKDIQLMVIKWADKNHISRVDAGRFIFKDIYEQYIKAMNAWDEIEKLSDEEFKNTMQAIERSNKKRIKKFLDGQ